MGRKASERRKRIVAEVAHKDALRKRNFERAVRKKQAKAKAKPKPKPKPKLSCCLDKYEDLPNGFKPCIDCPNNSS